MFDTSNRACTAIIGDGNPNSNFFFASADDDMGGFLASFDDRFDPAASDPIGSYRQYDKLISDILTLLMIAYTRTIRATRTRGSRV